MTTVPFNSGDAILQCLARPKVAPFRVMPASNSVYKLTTISEVLDGHTRKMHSNEKEDKPRRDVVASTLRSYRNGAVG